MSSLVDFIVFMDSAFDYFIKGLKALKIYGRTIKDSNSLKSSKNTPDWLKDNTYLPFCIRFPIYPNPESIKHIVLSHLLCLTYYLKYINSMTTLLDQILNEPDDCSSLSADASFTLEDILLQPDELLEDIKPNVEDYDDMFDDDDEDEPQENQQPIVISNESDKNESEPKKASGKEEEKSRSSKLIENKDAQKPNKVIARDRRLRDLPMPALNEVNNMTYIVLKNVTALFQNPEKNGVGIPTVISATGTRFLAVGTSMGNVAVFEVGVKGYKLLGTAQHKKYGQVTSIAISKDNKYLVCGQQGGLLSVWDLNYFSELKRELASKSKIIKLLFCSENEFILNDIEGNIYLYTIEKYLWVNLKSQRVFQKSDSYYYDIKAHTLHSNTQILALCTLDYVLVLSYKPQVVPLARITRPDDLYFSKLPNIQLGRCAVFSVFNPQNTEKHSSDVLCVSWSKSIFIYKFVQGKVQQYQSLQLMYRFEQETPIYNMQFISQGILVTLDNKETFRTYRLWVNNGGGYMMINQREVPQEVIYQRFLKDKNNRYIKSYNNTIISCSFNPKDKEIFFICKNSIYRCRIHRWNDAVNELINADRQFLKALKLCLELFNKRFNIFLEPVLITEKTIKLFCQIGRLFLVERLKEIQKLNLNRVKNMDQKSSIKLVQEQVEQAYECLIEYMIEIQSQNYLFERIFRQAVKQKHFSDEYHYKFLDCLEPFILNGALTRIPTLDFFCEITGHFLKQGKKNLVDNLIISLEVQSIFYAEAIEICEKNKLYRALAYVCSTHGEYVPPLNKLLREIVDAQKNGLAQAQQIYYMILKDYIVKLLGCVYVNGSPLLESPQIMKKSLSTWLTCRETFTFFAKNAEESYQKDYFYFLQGMIQSLNEEESLKEHIHGILKDLIKERHKEKEIAELFIKISSTVQLGQQEIELIVTHSNQKTIENNLVEYFEFVQKYIDKLQKMDQISAFVALNRQVDYFYGLLSQSKEGLLERTKILEEPREQLNVTLVKFILQKLSGVQIANDIEDLLKIHSSVTMIYMLEKFSLEVVNERLMTIKDTEYRYLVVRKLLKKLRKDQEGKQAKQSKLRKNVTGSKVARSALHIQRESGSSVGSSLQGERDTVRRRLGKEVMEFYISCLCKYKREKRVYYQFTAYMTDYQDNLPNIIKIIEPFGYSSVLGLLEETRQDDEAAYQYYSKVYRHYFFQENYKKLMRIVHCHGRFMRRIFQRMLAIAQRTNTEKRWIDLLSSVVKPLQEKSITGNRMVCDDIQQVFKKKSNHPFLQQLAQILELCLINVSNKIPIANFSNFIVAHGSIFVKEFVLNSFRTTLMTYSKNAYLYLLANEMIINDQVAQFQQIYTQKVVGSAFDTKCQQCGKLFQGEDHLKVYTCGHAYHAQCQAPSNSEEEQAREQEGQEKEKKVKSEKADRCQKCIVLQTGGDQFRPTQLPDFNQYEEGILTKGVKGIVNIIPSMVGVITSPITVFTSSSSLPTPLPTQPEQKLNIEQAEDEVYEYLAFEKTLKQKEQDFSHFLQDYQEYLQKY